MSIANQISTLAMPRTSREIKSEIQDEMQFHIESRVGELVEQGLTTDKARSTANNEFGDRDTYQKDCQRIGLGLQPWFIVTAVTGLVVSLAVIMWLASTINTMQIENAALAAQLASQSTPPVLASAPPTAVSSNQEFEEDLKGKITDADGNAIEGAKILLVHKSWPGGQYSQSVYDTETDEDGEYSFEDQFSTDMQNAFLVSVFAEGHVFESRYTVFKAKKKVRDFNFKLKPGTEIEYTFTDEDGNALADTSVYIAGRKLGNKEHMTYFQSADSATWETDEEGKLKLAFFNKGDKVTVNLMVDGEWQETSFKVGKETAQTVTAKKK